jgi:hypothetical protein
MKKVMSLVIFVVLTSLVVGCDGKGSPVNSDMGLTYVGAIGGECDVSALSKTRNTEDGTVNIYTTTDDIRVVASVNYNCGAPLEASCDINGKNVKMSIKDTCSDPATCYQRCKCDYPFEFQFKRKGTVDYNYTVELLSSAESGQQIISSGKLE